MRGVDMALVSFLPSWQDRHGRPRATATRRENDLVPGIESASNISRPSLHRHVWHGGDTPMATLKREEPHPPNPLLIHSLQT